MKSGELAKRTGVSADTLHHYERKGLLTPIEKQDNGYRHYDESAIGRVQLIRNALKLGFTLDELAPLLKERDRGDKPCKSVRNLAAKKLRDIEEQIAALSELRNQFSTMLENWDQALASSGETQQARLLEKIPILTSAAPAKIKKPARSRP